MTAHMPPAKDLFLKARRSEHTTAGPLRLTRAMAAIGLAQEMVDALNGPLQDYVPTKAEGGVSPDLAAAFGDIYLEDAAARLRAMKALREAVADLGDHAYGPVVTDLSNRIDALQWAAIVHRARRGGFPETAI